MEIDPFVLSPLVKSCENHRTNTGQFAEGVKDLKQFFALCGASYDIKGFYIVKEAFERYIKSEENDENSIKSIWMLFKHLCYEISIMSYHDKNKLMGAFSTDLLICNEVSGNEKNPLYKYLSHYSETLKPLKRIEMKNFFTTEKTRNRSNPSVIFYDNKFIVNCRIVNFLQKDACLKYESMDVDGKIRTQNYLRIFDRNFKPLMQHRELIDLTVTPKINNSQQVLGIEDIRIFERKNELWFTGTEYTKGGSRMVLGYLGDFAEIMQNNGKLEIITLSPVNSPYNSSVEKNWLHLFYENEVRIMYSTNPTEFYNIDFEMAKSNKAGSSLEMELYKSNKPICNLSHLRNSGDPVKIDDGYLFCCHSVYFFTPNRGRRYYHHFVYMDSNLIIRKISLPFYIDHYGVEYCASLTSDGEFLYLGAGIEDKEAIILQLSIEYVKSLLNDLLNF